MIRLFPHKAYPKKLRFQIEVDIESMRDIAEAMGIRVVYRDLHAKHPNLDARTRGNVIILDKSLVDSPPHHRCVLAEEIGHVLYPPRKGHATYYYADKWGQLDYTTRDNLSILVAKDETRALRFATNWLIPDTAFWRFARTGPHDYWEWLETFGVEGWFFDAKVGFIRAGQPPRERLKWREIITKG